MRQVSPQMHAKKLKSSDSNAARSGKKAAVMRQSENNITARGSHFFNTALRQTGFIIPASLA